MQYESIAGLFIVACIFFFLVGISTLARKQWFIAWLRGTLGFLCLVAALTFGLLSINLYSYQNLVSESPVATVSFERNGNKEYLASVVLAQGEQRSYRLTGDLWQVDVKMIKWEGLLNAIGFEPGYKLDRLQGRYIAIEDERSLERTVYALNDSDIGFDLWETIKSSSWLPWVDAVYGSATYQPMADGAIYSVTLSKSGLVARPINERAELAVSHWD